MRRHEFFLIFDSLQHIKNYFLKSLHAVFFPDKKQGERILVPGVLKGLHAVWKDYGRLKWASLWEPCIKLARQGFKVHESLANAIKGKGYHIRNNKGLRYQCFKFL